MSSLLGALGGWPRGGLPLLTSVLLLSCGPTAPEEPPPVMVAVAAAAADLQVGTPLDVNVVAQRSIDQRLVTKNVILASDATGALARKTLISLRAGDLLLWSALEEAAPSVTLSTKVDAGQRAMWLEVSEPVAPARYLRFGERIDVLGTFRDPGTNESIARTIAQNLRVLAASAESSGRGVAVAVQVTPRQAEQLRLAAELGNLGITVRGAGDDASPAGGGATMGSLLGAEPRPRRQ